MSADAVSGWARHDAAMASPHLLRTVPPSDLPSPWRERFDADVDLEDDVVFEAERPRSRVTAAMVFAVTVAIAVSIANGAVGAVRQDADAALTDLALALAAVLLAVFAGIRLARALRYRAPAAGLRAGTILADDGVGVGAGEYVTIVPTTILRDARIRAVIPFGRRVEVLVADAGGQEWMAMPLSDNAQRAIAAWVDQPGTRLSSHS